MAATTISPKYQIVIPKEIREILHFRPGQKIKMLVVDGVATIVPVLPLEQLEGIARGIDVEGYREEEDEER